MLLTAAQVKMFKSIDDSGTVPVDSHVTVLVGQNEAGKTAFLQALHKANSIEKGVSYDVIEDYPRKALTEYQKQHDKSPAEVVELTYELQDYERHRIKEKYGVELSKGFVFKVSTKYDGSTAVTLEVPEKPYIKHIIGKAKLPADIAKKVNATTSVTDLLSTFAGLDLNAESTTFFESLKSEFESIKLKWSNKLAAKIWSTELRPNIPKFLYFDDYYLLPGKVNLPALQKRISGKTLKDQDKTVLSLLRMAGVELDDLMTPAGYEKGRAGLEGISNKITDMIFEFWTQNQNLDVVIDIKPDPQDEAPFNEGNNLYIRIRNRRHRVTVPFSQRSKGFIWFFSFIVWFDAIQKQLSIDDDLVLLLDEPGLSLHALGQADLLRYIDHLAADHQLIYTSHSPFMIHSDRLHQTRTVQDIEKEGTKISSNISGSDPNTLFPLQAALGYTIAQNLFISTRNLLVEGPADLIYLRFFSAALEKNNGTFLREDITIVPVGGLDKLATFIALLGGNSLELAVLHDYQSKPDARLESLVREKLIRDKHVLNYAMFRAALPSNGRKTDKGDVLISSDVEDMISPETYLHFLNGAYKNLLGKTNIKESDLPPGDRMVDRITQYLKAKSITLRPSGGFNHYLVASHLASNPHSTIDEPTMDRFERLFEAVNSVFSK
jgi:hypothetical protein